MYLNFHTNTQGTLHVESSGIVVGSVGSSGIAIHPVLTSGGTSSVVQPPVGGCPESAQGLCSFPCGKCSAARFAVDNYKLRVPGEWAVAIHVIDGLDAAEQPAQVGSLNDDDFDPEPKRNAGVIGAAVYRGYKQTFVAASSGQDGATGPTLTYAVPGGSAARHIMYDAPEAADATSSVTAAADSGRCAITIQAGAGSGVIGRPLMFQVAPAAEGCTVKANTDVPPADAPPGGGVGGSTGNGGDAGNGGIGASAGTGGSGNGTSAGAGAGAGRPGASSNIAFSDDSGCACAAAGRARGVTLVGLFAALAVAFGVRRRVRR